MIFMVAIILLSLTSKQLKVKVLFPITFSLISIIMFFVSIIWGGWKGLGLGAISVLLFIASVSALIIVILLYKTDPRRVKNR